MKFRCSGCRVTFHVPDEKIPAGRELRILCPKCKMPVERCEEGEIAAGLESLQTQPDEDVLSTPEGEDQEEMYPTEVVEEGRKTALLCLSDNARAETLAEILRQLDFYVSLASSARFALDKLHRNHYDLVVLDELYDGTSQSENLVLHHIQFLPMHVRRQFFMCLVSEGLKTLDQMLAFRLGVDMILNAKDLDKAKILLVRAMKDHRVFYRAYSEELERKGQF